MNAIVSLLDYQLLALLTDIESDLVERKESFKGDTPDRARQAVCAFANDFPNHHKPGILFVGAKDNGEPSGLPITDELLLQLADMKTDGNILPLPVMTVEKRILQDAEIAVVMVVPSDIPPVKYKGRIWVRTGPRRSIASAQEERILNEKRKYLDQPWDLHPYGTATLDDLSKSYFEDEFLPKAFARDILEENNRTYIERLASCKMIYSLENPIPTLLGILTLSKDPQRLIPGAYIQFLRLDGTELHNLVIDELEAKGRFIDMIAQIEFKLQAHNRTKVDTSNGPHVLSYDYPHRAFQQILYNAVMHRTYEGTNTPVRVYWYNDRIEISSPGGPYGSITVENFGTAGFTDYRNPNITDIFKSLGYIQRYGTGINIAREEMKRNGNPPPQIEVNKDFVVCKFKAKE
jgi:ATP-dependent DNA helicase RecG